MSKPKHSGYINAAIGDHGELWLAANLPLGWIWQPPRRDLGKDGLIVVRDESDLHNLEFSVQVKSTKRPTFSGKHIVIKGVSRSSVQYWFASPLPTLVVAIDVTSHCAWYAWHLDLFASPAALFNSNTKDVAIRIPTENLLQGPGWDRIRKYLRGHFRSLQDALAMGHTAVRVVAAINLMTAALKNLVKLLDYQVPNGHPSQEEGITILLEMIQHRDLIVAARSVLERISPESIVHKQLLFGVEAYESTMRVGFPLIDQLPEQGGLPPEHQLAYSPHAVRENRSRLIDSGFDLLLLLTKIGPVPLPNAA